MRVAVAGYVSLHTGRPKKPLEIADAGWEKLSMIASPKSAQAMAMARIVLSCRGRESNSEVPSLRDTGLDGNQRTR